MTESFSFKPGTTIKRTNGSIGNDVHLCKEQYKCLAATREIDESLRNPDGGMKRAQHVDIPTLRLETMSLAPRKSKQLDMMPWEVERRRSSMSAQSRRNSILSVSLFDFTFSPQHTSRPTFETDVDPFAPLSIHEGIPMTGIGRQQPNQSIEAMRFSPDYRASYHSHILSDRSESSAMSTPSPRYSMVGATPTAVHSRSNQIVSPPGGPQQYRASYSSPVKMPATLKPVITPDQALKPSPFGVRPAYKKQSRAMIAKLPLSNDDEEDDEEDDDEDDDGSHRFKAFHEEKWTFRYKELLEYHKENGHAAVPHTFPKNPQLARWYVRLSASAVAKRKDAFLVADHSACLTSRSFFVPRFHL